MFYIQVLTELWFESSNKTHCDFTKLNDLTIESIKDKLLFSNFFAIKVNQKKRETLVIFLSYHKTSWKHTQFDSAFYDMFLIIKLLRLYDKDISCLDLFPIEWLNDWLSFVFCRIDKKRRQKENIKCDK